MLRNVWGQSSIILKNYVPEIIILTVEKPVELEHSYDSFIFLIQDNGNSSSYKTAKYTYRIHKGNSSILAINFIEFWSIDCRPITGRR